MADFTQEGSIEVALSRLRWAAISSKAVADTLATSFVSPELTAYTTEVQRISILDTERDIATFHVHQLIHKSKCNKRLG